MDFGTIMGFAIPVVIVVWIFVYQLQKGKKAPKKEHKKPHDASMDNFY